MAHTLEPRLLELYDTELRLLRGLEKEFFREHPDLSEVTDDPHVERLLEAFAFLTARIHLQLDREFPRFTQHLLELVYPNYLTPTPAMAVVQLVPDLRQPLESGHVLPRATRLRADAGGTNKCDFLTAHEVTLFPIELAEAEYQSLLPAIEGAGPSARAALRLRLAANVPLLSLALDRLPLFVAGADATAARCYELLLSHAVALAGRAVSNSGPQRAFRVGHVGTAQDPCSVPLGFDDNEALLEFDAPQGSTPRGPRTFGGYRLLQEYFAFPQRFMFVELRGLRRVLLACLDADRDARVADILVMLDWPRTSGDPGALDGAVTRDTFRLHCTPAVNLFYKSADPILVRERSHEHRVVPDVSRPASFEVHSVCSVVGYRTGGARVDFGPLYSLQPGAAACFTVERRVAGDERDAEYLASELYLSLVDGNDGPGRRDLRRLEVGTFCTNRGLPLKVGRATPFSCQSDGTVSQVRCVAGPSRPRAAPSAGEVAWRLVNHLGVNFLSLLDADGSAGAPALRRMLELYRCARLGARDAGPEINGIASVAATPVVRPLPGPSLAYGRGLEIRLRCDELCYPGTGAFLFSAVLERFLARYASINSFTQTVLDTLQRGEEVMRWPIRSGRRTLI